MNPAITTTMRAIKNLAIKGLMIGASIGIAAVLGGCGGAGFAEPNGTAATTTYPVGGTVSGLTGAGLALQLNGSNTLYPNNGNFKFLVQLETGATFRVTVSAQPLDATCSVSNGNGAINDAPVTNIAVTCSTTTFQIGGRVTGLIANQNFTLQNNGGDTLPVSANGNFTFTTPVAANGSYSVTVGTQAADQTCSVSGGSGALVTANITGVLVTCSNNSYSVGGTVTGLTASQQVTLALNNGQTIQTVTGNNTSAPASFTFSTPVAYGSGYGVTITNTPTNVSCTVTNGTGTMNDAPVTNVAVTCSPIAFQIGGTVSQLDPGQSFTLINNSSETLPITANGTFNFSVPVAKNGSYSVIVGNQPANQTCSVTSGAGGGVVAPISNVSVVCTNDTYNVSGTVIGLTGSQQINLSLNNGQAMLPVSGSSTSNQVLFAFAPVIPYGGTYNVAVTNSPAGVICSVAGNASNPVTTNVTGIVVQCSTQQFTLTGSVSGLANGEQVTINNNGTNSQILTSSHPGFSYTIPYGGTFNIQIGTQPLTQACSVSNGTPSAVVTSAPVASTISCANHQYEIVWTFGANTTTPTGQSVEDGISPAQGLLEASDHKLYGVTNLDMQFGFGTIYRFDPLTQQEQQVYQFTGGANGNSPVGKLIQGRDGLLYGITSFNAFVSCTPLCTQVPSGTVYSFDPLSLTINTLYTFTGTATDGGHPSGALVQGNIGDDSLYGVTQLGGAYGNGTIFQLTLPTGTTPATLKSIYSFGKNPADGTMANGPLLLTASNIFYGTSATGGANNAGTLFQFQPAAGPSPATMNVIHTFGSGTDGSQPNGTLTLFNGGKIVGTANQGGTGTGTIFTFDPSQPVASAYSSFPFPQYTATSNTPAYPSAGLTVGNDGNLWGVSSGGGNVHGTGTLYEYNPITNTFVVWHEFGALSSDGISPASDLMIARNGYFYGTAPSGGNDTDGGIIFQY